MCVCVSFYVMPLYLIYKITYTYVCVFILEKGVLFVQFILADHIALYFFYLKGQRIKGEYKSRRDHFVLQ